jgi:asparagine synthase (glutamine-hydrolysing)
VSNTFPFQKKWEELLAVPRLGDEGFFHVGEVRTKWQQHLSGVADWQHLLWPVLMFQAWFDHYERSH